MGKPIVFVQPLSESLQKLKDTISADEAYSIYELDDPAEYKQLVGTIGASLTITSDLKKMAKVLSENKVIYRKNNNKALMLSSEKLAFGITDKLQKLGLTEILYEPIVPKTLLYKVSLLCKSLKNVEEKGAQEVVIKSLKQEKDSSETKLEEKKAKERQEAEEIKNKEEKTEADLKPEKKNNTPPAEVELDLEKKKKGQLDLEAEKTPEKKKAAALALDEIKPKEKAALELAEELEARKKEIDNSNITAEEKLQKKRELLQELKERRERAKFEAIEQTQKEPREKPELAELAEVKSAPEKLKPAPLQAEAEAPATKEIAALPEIEDDKERKNTVLEEIAAVEEKKSKLIALEEEEFQKRNRTPIEQVAPREAIKREAIQRDIKERAPAEKREAVLPDERAPREMKLRTLEEVAPPAEKKERNQLVDENKGRKKDFDLALQDDSNDKEKKKAEEDQKGPLAGRLKKKEDEDELALKQKKEKSQVDDATKRQRDLNLELAEDEEEKEDKSDVEKVKKDRKRDLNLELEDENERERIAQEKKKNKDKKFNIADETPELNLKKSFEEEKHELDLEYKEKPPELDTNWDYENQGLEEVKVVDYGEEQVIDYSEFDEYIESSFAQYKRPKKKRDHDTEKAGYSNEALGDQQNEEEASFAYGQEELIARTPHQEKLEELLEEFYHQKAKEGLSEEELKAAAKAYVQEQLIKKDGNPFVQEAELKKEIRKGKEFIPEVALDKQRGQVENTTIEEKNKTKQYYSEAPAEEKLEHVNAATIADVLAFPTAATIEEAIVIDSPIISANLHGLEYVMGAQRLMQKKAAKPEDVLEYIADKLLLKTNSMVTYYEYHDSVYTMKYSSQHLCLEPALYFGMSWEDCEKVSKERWEKEVTPVWEDVTFTQERNVFIYPFYDGDKPLGMAVVHSWGQIKNTEQSFYVEILIEATRGYFLHRQELNEGTNIIQLETVKKEKVSIKKVVKTFFKKLFGMAA